MKKWMILTALLLSAAAVQAGGFGFGVSAGAFSPNKGLEDNDNGVLLGANLMFKFATFGVKVEGYYVDSSGRYEAQLGDSFGESNLDMEALLAADFMFYPLATTFFLQAGVNYMSLDASGLVDENFDEVIDNQLGISAGLGASFFDKLWIQGKILYTPDAVNSDVAEAVSNLDENLLGFMATVGWKF